MMTSDESKTAEVKVAEGPTKVAEEAVVKVSEAKVAEVKAKTGSDAPVQACTGFTCTFASRTPGAPFHWVPLSFIYMFSTIHAIASDRSAPSTVRTLFIHAQHHL